MEFVQVYFKHLNKLAFITYFLAFFLFLFERFSLLDLNPDSGRKMNADPDPQLLAGTAYRYADISVAIYCLLKSTLQEPPFLAASGPDPAPAP